MDLIWFGNIEEALGKCNKLSLPFRTIYMCERVACHAHTLRSSEGRIAMSKPEFSEEEEVLEDSPSNVIERKEDAPRFVGFVREIVPVSCTLSMFHEQEKKERSGAWKSTCLEVHAEIAPDLQSEGNATTARTAKNQPKENDSEKKKRLMGTPKERRTGLDMRRSKRIAKKRQR